MFENLLHLAVLLDSFIVYVARGFEQFGFTCLLIIVFVFISGLVSLIYLSSLCLSWWWWLLGVFKTLKCTRLIADLPCLVNPFYIPS